VKRIAGVLLDVDGTLLDSNDAHAMAYVDALRAHGVERGFAEVRKLIGMGSDRILPKLADVDAESELGKAISDQKRSTFRERYLSGLRPTRGARQLVQHLGARGLKLVVASSASGDELNQLLEAAQVADLLEAAVSSDDAEASKPAPDIVEAAVRRSGLAKERLIMLGDTPYDVEAALRAGIRIIALRSGGWDDRALAGAVSIHDDPASLLDQIESSPLAA
jgi:HAD superfamily hydrolase (TIGR01509 family)